MLYLVQNRAGCVEPPMYYDDIRKGDKVIAEFVTDGYHTDEENFFRFTVFVKSQEGRLWTSYNAEQLKELYDMWRESLQ